MANHGHRGILFCLVLSGFCGLSYELLWIRLLSFAFGSTTLSFATVLAVFFAGLAIGSFVAAQALPYVKAPYKAYAYIEILMGLACLGLYPILKNLPAWFALIDPGPGVAGGIARFAVAAPLLLVPTVLMGMTLPIICKGFIKKDAGIGSGASLVYGFNTFGAFLGTFLTTYVLIIQLGVFYSHLVVAAVNFVVGGLALYLGRDEPRKIVDFKASQHQKIAADKHHNSTNTGAVPARVTAVIFAITFLSGFSFICFEVVWSRVFSVLLSGTVYGVGSVLICVLAGIAVGSWLTQIVFRLGLSLLVAYASFQLILLSLNVVIIHNVHIVGYFLQFVAEATGKQIDPIYTQLLATMLVLTPPSIAAGTALPLLVRYVARQASLAGQVLGRLFAVNTIGSIIGSLLTGFVLLPMLGSETTILIGLLAIAVPCALLILLSETKRQRYLLIALATLATYVATQFDGYDRMALDGFTRTDGQSFASRQQRVELSKQQTVLHSEGKSANVTVVHTGDGISMRLNGLGQGVRMLLPPNHILESLLVALVPLVHAQEVDNALIVGLGAGVTVDLFDIFGVKNTVVVELEEKVVAANDLIFLGDNPVNRDGVSVKINDARHFLLRNFAQSERRFDVITSMPAHPWVSGNIFTREFFQIAKNNLSESGVFSTWFGIGKMDLEILQSLIAAFTDVFEEFVIYEVPEAGAYYLVGAKQGLRYHVARAAELFDHPAVTENRMLKPDFLLSRVTGSGVASTERLTTGLLNTDDYPLVELRAPMRKEQNINFDIGDWFSVPYMKSDFLETTDPLKVQKDYLARASEEVDLPLFAAISPRKPQVFQLLALAEHILQPESNDTDLLIKARLAAHAQNHELLESLSELVGNEHGVVKDTLQRLIWRSKIRDNPNYAMEILNLPRHNAEFWLDAIELDLTQLNKWQPSQQPDRSVDPWSWLAWIAHENVDGNTQLQNAFHQIIREHPGAGNRLASAFLLKHAAKALGLVEMIHLLEMRIDQLRKASAAQLEALAQNHYGRNEFAKALPYFELALAYTPWNEKILQRMYFSYVEEENHQGKEAVLEKFSLLGKSDYWRDQLEKFYLDRKSDTQEIQRLRALELGVTPSEALLESDTAQQNE